MCSSWMCLWFPQLPALCVSVTVQCGIRWCFMGNWILTIQRHVFPSSSRVTPRLTDPWRWRLCVLLKYQNHITPCYKVVSQMSRVLCYSAAKIWKPTIPSISYTCMYCCYLIYSRHHFLPNNTLWPVLIPSNTSNILI